MEMLPSIYSFERYSDVLNHIKERHGDEGCKIVDDPNSMPVLWHEFSHVQEGVTWDHEHEGTNTESVQERLDSAMSMVQNPLFAEYISNMSPEDLERMQ